MNPYVLIAQDMLDAATAAVGVFGVVLPRVSVLFAPVRLLLPSLGLEMGHTEMIRRGQMPEVPRPDD